MKRCSRRSKDHRRLARFLIAATATLAIGLASCASFQHLTQVSNTFPQAKDCAECHIDIHQEWTASDHAHAYSNPHFRAATDDCAFNECLNCHAPEPMLTAQTPAVRSAGREEAVTCVACHLEQGRLSGPLEPTGRVRPHPIGVRPEVYRDTGICGRCHQGTFEQWADANEGKQTCQQCHMPEVARKMTQSTGGFASVLVAMEHQTPQRRHTFAIPTSDSTDGMIDLEVRRDDSGAQITLRNRLPHGLPTGDYGFRVLVLEVAAADGQGEEHVLIQEELAPETKTAISPEGTWQRTVTIPADSVSLRVRLRRHSYEDQDVLDLLDRRVSL